MTARPRLLDLFCCAGGAGVGYQRAGFEVVGVDIDPQPRYPLMFMQADVLTLDRRFLASFDAIHASPPCQSYSDLAKRNGNADAWPRLIEPVRQMLRESSRPYVIENVEGAPLLDPIVLCGTMFSSLRVIRHRLFESNVELTVPAHQKHPLVFTHDKRKGHYGQLDQDTAYVQVTGGGNCSIANARAALGIDWMTKNELNESIPPTYTRYVGAQILRHMAAESEPSFAVREPGTPTPRLSAKRRQCSVQELLGLGQLDDPARWCRISAMGHLEVDSLDKIEIAEGTSEDVAEIAALFGQCSGRQADDSRIARNMSMFPSFVARSSDGTMVGFIFTDDFAPDVLEIANILLLPEYQSRHLGGRLVDAVEQAARSRGFIYMVLVNSMLYPTTYVKRPATTFYRRLGYKIVIDTGPSKIFSKKL